MKPYQYTKSALRTNKTLQSTGTDHQLGFILLHLIKMLELVLTHYSITISYIRSRHAAPAGSADRAGLLLGLAVLHAELPGLGPHAGLLPPAFHQDQLEHHPGRVQRAR